MRNELIVGIWPELLGGLSVGLDSADENVKDLSLDSLEKMAEAPRLYILLFNEHKDLPLIQC